MGDRIMQGSVSGSSGLSGVPSLLGILFVALKLTGVIGWSWFWVLSPFWIAGSLWMAVLVVIVLVLAMREAWRR